MNEPRLGSSVPTPGGGWMALNVTSSWMAAQLAMLSSWTAHPGYNCYSGNGAVPVDPTDKPLGHKSVLECGKACDGTAGCKAFTVHSNTESGDCWLRASIDLSRCQHPFSGYDTYDHSPPPPPLPPPIPRPAAFALVKRIGSGGVNLGNVLEAPHEGDWAAPLQEFYFDDLAARGFTAVRIGVRWDEHTGKSAPYTVDAAFLERVATVAGWCVARKLICSINQHHDDWIGTALVADEGAFSAALERFVAIWAQAASRLQDVALDGLVFEIYNEPHVNTRPFNGTLADDRVNRINAAGLSAIRKVAFRPGVRRQGQHGRACPPPPYPRSCVAAGERLEDLPRLRSLVGRA